jgi:hypothetical protein
LKDGNVPIFLKIKEERYVVTGQYDRTMKVLVDGHPEAVTRFVLHAWQQQGLLPQEQTDIVRVTQLSRDFQSNDREGDTVLLVEGPQGPQYMVQLEFQSRLDSFMPIRSLEYCARAKKKHWQAYGDVPIIAAVISLFQGEGSNVPVPPLRWIRPDGQPVLLFSYLSIPLQAIAREEWLALHCPELWPLVLLTKEPPDRIRVREMLADLAERRLYDLLPLGNVVASWRLQGEDRQWLQQEYQKMFELFEDAPAFRWMEEDVTRSVTRQVTEQVTEQVTKRVRQEEQAKAAKALRKQREKDQRQLVVTIITQRFPELARLARAQVRLLTRPEEFERMIAQLLRACELEEAQEVLLTIPEEATEDEAQEIPG